MLIASGCWDPYNVTEDADLGIRLARLGWQVAVLQSATWEEAPPDLSTWFKQRTRWLKGWMQTLIVHTRQPRRLARDLGLRPVTGFIVLMTGMVLSALVHPWFYALIAARALGFEFADTKGTDLLWPLGYANLVAGYAISAVVAAVGARRAGYRGLIGHIVFIPFYWLLISAAAYGALWELFTAPHHWHKTPHLGRAPNSPSR